MHGSQVFHAGTSSDGPVVKTNGGRVLAITSLAKDLPLALERSYANAAIIKYERAYYRKDIGKDLQ